MTIGSVFKTFANETKSDIKLKKKPTCFSNRKLLPKKDFIVRANNRLQFSHPDSSLSLYHSVLSEKNSSTPRNFKQINSFECSH